MSITVGKIEGIKIELNYSLLLAFALITWSIASGFLPTEYPGYGLLFYWGIGALSAVALFLSILAHELSHSTVALRQGLGIKSITLFFFGGVSQIEENSKTPSNELKMALAGPLMSLFIGAVLYAVYYILDGLGPASLRAVFHYVGYVNLLLGFFNLVPAFPMDGGRVLRSLIWRSKKDMLNATRMATKISHIISYIFIGIGFLITFISFVSGFWMIFLGIFINRGAEAELNQSVSENKLKGLKVSDLMETKLETLTPETTIKKLNENYIRVYSQMIYPVKEDNEIIGFIFINDVKESDENKEVGSIMKHLSTVQKVEPDDDALDAFLEMTRNNLDNLLVFKNNKFVGIITITDLEKAIKNEVNPSITQ
jgi:Zn-dependent protease